jgi:hypothetical protein
MITLADLPSYIPALEASLEECRVGIKALGFQVSKRVRAPLNPDIHPNTIFRFFKAARDPLVPEDRYGTVGLILRLESEKMVLKLIFFGPVGSGEIERWDCTPKEGAVRALLAPGKGKAFVPCLEGPLTLMLPKGSPKHWRPGGPNPGDSCGPRSSPT